MTSFVGHDSVMCVACLNGEEHQIQKHDSDILIVLVAWSHVVVC